MKYHIGYDVFIGLFVTTLLGGEFDNCHGQGKTQEEAVKSLVLRVSQLRHAAIALPKIRANQLKWRKY